MFCSNPQLSENSKILVLSWCTFVLNQTLQNTFEGEQQRLIIIRVFDLMFLFTTHLIGFYVCMKANFIVGLKINNKIKEKKYIKRKKSKVFSSRESS